MIWDAAINRETDRPGVHVLRIKDTIAEASIVWASMKVASSGLDAGIWTACRRSRERMKYFFRHIPATWPGTAPHRLPQDIQMPTTVAFRADPDPHRASDGTLVLTTPDGGFFQITMFPHRDLFMLDFAFPWNSQGQFEAAMYRSWLWPSMNRITPSPSTYPESRGQPWAYRGIRHIVVEWDQVEWSISRGEDYDDVDRAFQQAVLEAEAGGLDTIWFNLMPGDVPVMSDRHQEGLSGQGRDRFVFTGGDRRYVEIDRRWVIDWLSPRDGDCEDFASNGESTYFCDCGQFIRSIAYGLRKRYWEAVRRGQPPWEDLSFGILATDFPASDSPDDY